jgi:hypothetical protein
MALKRTSKAAGLLCAFVCGAALARQPHLGPPPRDIASCRFASADADTRFIVAGVMEGDTLSNLQFGDPNGESTIVRVEIDPGLGPLALFLHSETPVIWDFEGAVERVKSAFIVTRNRTRQVASRGLPEEVVKFPDRSSGLPVCNPTALVGREQC